MRRKPKETALAYEQAVKEVNEVHFKNYQDVMALKKEITAIKDKISHFRKQEDILISKICKKHKVNKSQVLTIADIKLKS